MLRLHLVPFSYQLVLQLLLSSSQLYLQLLFSLLCLMQLVLILLFKLLGALVLLLHLSDHRCNIILKLLDPALMLSDRVTTARLTSLLSMVQRLLRMLNVVKDLTSSPCNLSKRILLLLHGRKHLCLQYVGEVSHRLAFECLVSH